VCRVEVRPRERRERVANARPSDLGEFEVAGRIVQAQDRGEAEPLPVGADRVDHEHLEQVRDDALVALGG
jgi:hypothetical protein